MSACYFNVDPDGWGQRVLNPPGNTNVAISVLGNTVMVDPSRSKIIVPLGSNQLLLGGVSYSPP